MANVVITFKIMPASPEEDLDKIRNEAQKRIKKFGGEVYKTEEVPIAFGLKSVNIMFLMDENKGSTEELEKEISELQGVNSVDVIDVRRAVG
jgi:translation elongation factor aEF-1 beta